jgi:tRNA nucleotidyltransferase (CCA-adding enzyme)
MDVVVEGDAGRLGRSLEKAFGGRLVRHPQFKTATWYYNDVDALDLITARSETYRSPGALPTVTPSSIQDDLRRRDFTINAMAMRLDRQNLGELIDVCNGRLDLERGIIRILHPRSFLDDPTRIVRAIRYEQRYEFAIETGTRDLINAESIHGLSKISGERLRHEFDLVFMEQRATQMFQRVNELGLMQALKPDLPDFNPDDAIHLNTLPDPEFGFSCNPEFLGMLLWLIHSDPAHIRLAVKRLDLSREISGACLAAAGLLRVMPMKEEEMKPSGWVERLANTPLVAVYAVWLVSAQDSLREFLVNWRHVHPRTTGHDLRKLGLPPDPRYGKILKRLRNAWLDGEVHTEAEERELLRSLL